MKYNNIKIKISCPEHSEYVQKVLFDMGYKWSCGKELEYLDKPYLYAREYGLITFGSQIDTFNEPLHEDYTNHPDFIWPRPEKSPFEVGQYYKTRGGTKAFYIGKNEFGSHVFDINARDYILTTDTGVAKSPSYKYDFSYKDIIGKWPEEERFAVATNGEEVQLLQSKTKLDAEISMYEEQGWQVKQVVFNTEEE